MTVASDRPQYRLRVETLREFDRRHRGLISAATIRCMLDRGGFDLTWSNGQPDFPHISR